MKRKSFINKILFLLIFVFSLVSLTACGKTPTLSFEKTDVSLKVGETHELAPVITELEGTDLVNYTVSEEGVISISGNVVTALKGGSVVITATLKEYPEVTATVNVTVDGKVKSITIDMINKVEVEGTITLKANVLPEKADNKEIEWSVSDSSILKIEGNKVVALAIGTAKVIATAKDGSGVKAELEIKVTKKASELLGTIELSCDNENVIVGNTVKMNAVVDTEAEDKTLVWSVSNDNATVNANGEVTFVKAGEVEVTASLKANPIRKATYVFNCKDKIVGLELSARKAEYRIGDTEKLGVTFEPLSSKNVVEYASSDASIVSVDENGNIAAIKTGKATITVTSKLQPEIKATVEITVGAQQIVYYVSKDLAETAAGAAVTVNGLSYVMGTTAFADLDDALAVAKDNEAIAIAAGTYEDEYTITQNGLTIIGPNEVVNPNYENRNAEATFVNVINVAASNVTISGVCFSKAGRVVADAAGGINDLTVSSVVFDSQITNGDSSKGCIHFESPVDNLSKNLTVVNSRFEKTGKRTQALMVDGIEGMTLKNNYFEGNPGTFNDTIKMTSNGNTDSGMHGNILVEGNEFVNSSQYTLWFVGGVYDVNIDVIGNKFIGCGDHDAGYLRAVITISSLTISDGFKSTINVEKNVFEDVDSAVRIQYGTLTADKLAINVKDNKFLSWRHDKVIVNNNSTTPAKDAANIINAEYNYFEGGAKEELFSGVASYANEYATEADCPSYTQEGYVLPNDLFITNKTSKLDAFSEYLVEFEVGPANATNKKVLFESSNKEVATISSAGLIVTGSEGECTITIRCVADNSLVDSFTFTVTPVSRLEATYSGNGVIKVGETDQIEVSFFNNVDEEKFTFKSSNESVATVDQTGIVTAKADGNVEITVTSTNGKTIVLGFTCISDKKYEEYSDLMQLLINNNLGMVLNQNLYYIGSDDGSADYLHNIYGSVNNYYAAENPEVIRNMLPQMRPNHSKMEMASIEFITVHDTAGSPSTSTAKANSGWCVNIGNTATSWHYTIGNDGIYQQLEDNIVGRHAGDGGNGATTVLTDTGVKATVLRPECTLGEDGYVYILGQKSNIKYPEGATGITETGLGVVVGDNGNYFMPTLRLASQGPGEGKNVCIYGGNANSIGIETAVNAGSDVYLTWQILAKFCAEKLVQYKLNSDRVRFHNSFDGKLCPRTMMTAGLVDEFLALVDCEYQIAKNYPDAKITFKSNNPDIIDDSGRVVATPELTTNVTYTITVEQGGKTESITLNAVIVGQYNIFVG